MTTQMRGWSSIFATIAVKPRRKARERAQIVDDVTCVGVRVHGDVRALVDDEDAHLFLPRRDAAELLPVPRAVRPSHSGTVADAQASQATPARSSSAALE
ncbi:MAG: hypothetical protein NVS3B7_12980 [Candidatus Elarobacter sp.]